MTVGTDKALIRQFCLSNKYFTYQIELLFDRQLLLKIIQKKLLRLYPE